MHVNFKVVVSHKLISPRQFHNNRKISPSVVFIAETWTDKARLDRTLSKINFDKKWVVPRLNRGGGLVLFWKSSINIEVVDSHRYYVDTIINGNTEDA